MVENVQQHSKQTQQPFLLPQKATSSTNASTINQHKSKKMVKMKKVALP
jgi:hypothetical protein